jgi:hypothetical protein
MSHDLDAIATRIVALGKDEAASLLNRAVAPVLRALKWRPAFSTNAIEALIASHGTLDAKTPSIEAASRELAKNVALVERAAAIDGHVPTAHAAWLWRSYQVIRRLQDDDRAAARRASAPADLVSVLAPLTVTEPSSRHELHLDSVDPVLGAALDEDELLGRRRRLLEAARELLLDSAAALDVDAEGVKRRMDYIASEIARLDRLQAAGLSADVTLVHQARQALGRGDAQRLHAALAAMEGMGARRGGGRLSRLSQRALDVLWSEEDRFDEKASAASLARSGAEVLSPQVVRSVARGYERARAALTANVERPTAEELLQREATRKHLQGAVDEETVFATLRVDGCFDVGGAASPVRVVEERRRVRRVPFPTQDMLLVPAESPEDLPTALIEDPRRVLLDLATGRLLARRYVLEEVRHEERTKLRTEVRVYVLDGSGSMLGPRARMRDAILVAELSTLIARYQDAQRRINPVLYYCYFNKQVGPIARVDNADSALTAIESVLAAVHSGGTDIEGALLASLRQIGAAQQKDPDLASAQIVLVTDGEAAVDADRIQAARSSLGALPVGVSIIALGEENTALRRLASLQRKRGERVFYQFVADSELEAIVQGRNAGLPLHLPREPDLSTLRTELEAILDDAQSAVRVAASPADEQAELRLSAFDEVELPLDDVARDAERAKLEAARRDMAAVERRFARWFPSSVAPDGSGHEAVNTEDPDVNVVLSLLLSTAEVVELVGAAGLNRKLDAIEIFERLLGDAGIPPWRYATLVRRHATRLAPALSAVQRSVNAG